MNKAKYILFYVVCIFIGIYFLLSGFKNILLKHELYDNELIIPSIIFSSMIVALISILINQYENQKNKDYDESKEQLKYLYSPLNALIEKEYKQLVLEKYNSFKKDNNVEDFEIKYYNFFLKSRNIYLDNQVYSSNELFKAFFSLIHFHETEYRNSSNKFESEKDIIKDLAKFTLNHQKDNDENSKFERLIEKVIDVVHEDMYKIVNDKEPVKRYFQEQLK